MRRPVSRLMQHSVKTIVHTKCALIGLLGRQSGCRGRNLTAAAAQSNGSSAGQKHGAPGAPVAGEIPGLEEAQQVQYARGEKGDTLVHQCDVPLRLQGAVSSCMKHLLSGFSAPELAGEGSRVSRLCRIHRLCANIAHMCLSPVFKGDLESPPI